MNAVFFLSDFNAVLDCWIEEINRYSYAQLCAKPAPDSWSLGQLCRHLIDDTTFYISQIKICLSVEENEKEEMDSRAKLMFLNGSFPDMQIKGEDSHTYMPQPRNKEQLIDELIALKSNVNEACQPMRDNIFRGKTKHPGLGYFSAEEWPQFAGMHFRHHEKQKNRIEEFLKQSFIYDL